MTMTRYRVGGERERRIVLTFFVAGLLAGGCDISHVVGSFGGGGGSGGAVFYNADAGYPGDVMPLTATESWTGNLDNYQFASGSSAVRLSFATDPNGVVVGIVIFGQGSPPPPATDPGGIYPPGPSQVLPNTVVEGFPYRIAQGTLAGSQLKFTLWEGEVWSGWCALQTMIDINGLCLPNGTTCPMGGGQCSYRDPQTGVSTPISDAQVELCLRGACVCNNGSCVWSVAESGSVQFDMMLSGTTGSDNSLLINGDFRTAHFTKDP